MICLISSGQVWDQRVEVLLISGAMMLELGLKDAIKDIDIICRSEEDKGTLLGAAKSLDFQIVGPEKRHERLGVNRLTMKGGRNRDILFARSPRPKDWCSRRVLR